VFGRGASGVHGRASLLAVCWLAAVACGGRARTDAGAGAGTTNGGAPSVMGAAGAPAEVECVLAVRLDQCCLPAQPVSRAELDADPCLAEWSPFGASPPANPACAAAPCNSPCLTIPPVSSRLVAPDASGTCHFVSECATPDDCVAVRNVTLGCCEDPIGVPLSLAASEPCLLGPDQSSPAQCQACAGDVCGPNGWGPVVCTVNSDGFSQCGVDAPAPSPSCTDDQTCTGDCGRCEAPTPATCGSCTADADCVDRSRCGGANDECRDGLCQPRTCTDPSDCAPNSFCVDGGCSPEPGTCLYSCAP